MHAFPIISQNAEVDEIFHRRRTMAMARLPCISMQILMTRRCKNPGPRINIKMTYQYRNSHYKDKTVVRPSYLYNGNPYPERPSLYWKGALIISDRGVDLFIPKYSGVSTSGQYNDVIMSAIASQMTSLTIVYSTVYSDADQRKHKSSASLAFVREIHRWPVNFPHKWPVTRKMFPLHDVIMSWDMR